MDSVFQVSEIRHAVYQLRDPAEFSVAISGGQLVANFFAKQASPTRIEQFQTSRWALDFQEAHVKAHIHCPLPPDWVSVGLMRGPVESTWYGQQAAAGILMCNPPGYPIDGCIVPGFQCLTMNVPVAVWKRCAALAGCGDDALGMVSAVRLPAGTYEQAERGLRSLVPLLRNAAANPARLNETTDRVSGFITEIMVSAWEISSGIEVLPGSNRNRTRLAHRAEEWLRAHLGEPVQIPDLCLAFGVSRRELEYAFRLTFDQSPRDFLQALRLNAIRRLLKNSGGDDSLLEIAYNHGISHLGRFASNYRALFGENPSLSRKKSMKSARGV